MTFWIFANYLQIHSWALFWNHVSHLGFFQKAISQLFDVLLSWNSKHKLITQKYIIGLAHFAMDEGTEGPQKGLKGPGGPQPSAGARRMGASVRGSQILHLTCSASISWNKGRILMFKVSKWPYQSSQHDDIICRWCHNPSGGENMN